MYDSRYSNRQNDQVEAIKFVEVLWQAPIPKIAIENPIGVLSTKSKLGKPTQIVQPYWFGHTVSKKTCFWLVGLKPLRPTKLVEPNIITFSSGKKMDASIHKLWADKERSMKRSITLQGVAEAMAEQWG